MTTFVDTSALYALLDEDDDEHARAADWMRSAGAEPSRVLTTHTFVVVEAAALVHRRLGTGAVRSLLDGLLPAITLSHVDDTLYRAGVIAYRAGLQRGSSLVDHVSFEYMRERGIVECFGFDEDFDAAGFTLVPGD